MTEADVMAWDRSRLATTGLKIDGDLAVIDVDVLEPALVRALAEGMDKSSPSCSRAAGAPRRRHQGGVDRARRRTLRPARVVALASRR